MGRRTVPRRSVGEGVRLRVSRDAWLRLGAELRAIERTHFALEVPSVAVDLQEALCKFDRVRHRLRLENREAADHFLGFGERAVHRGELAFTQSHTRAFLRGPQPGGANQHTLSGHLVHELSHVLHQLLTWRLAAVFVYPYHREESHLSSPSYCCYRLVERHRRRIDSGSFTFPRCRGKVDG